MTETAGVVTDAESQGGLQSEGTDQQQFELVANTSGSMKVIVTKQGAEGEIIDEAEYGGQNQKGKLPTLN